MCYFDEMMRLKPSDIMFSQENINNYFDKRSDHGTRLIGETLDDLCEGRCLITDIPTIRVMNRDGKWVTADNRRLWVFRELERLGKCDKILVRQTYYIDPRKLNSYNGGTSVRVRRYAGGRWHNKPSAIRSRPKTNATSTTLQRNSTNLQSSSFATSTYERQKHNITKPFTPNVYETSHITPTEINSTYESRGGFNARSISKPLTSHGCGASHTTPAEISSTDGSSSGSETSSVSKQFTHASIAPRTTSIERNSTYRNYDVNRCDIARSTPQHASGASRTTNLADGNNAFRYDRTRTLNSSYDVSISDNSRDIFTSRNDRVFPRENEVQVNRILQTRGNSSRYPNSDRGPVKSNEASIHVDFRDEETKCPCTIL